MLTEKRASEGKPLLDADDRQPLAPIPFDRRRCRRDQADGVIMAAFSSEESGITLARVEVINASRGGVALRSPVAIKPGARFSLHRESLPLPGERGTVARCSAREQQFLLGLRFDAAAAA